MFAGLKRFDIHSKAIDGVNQQTIFGALLTLVTTALVVVLVASEFSNFMQVETVSRMAVSQTSSIESIKLDFDVVFHQLGCDRFTFVQEVTRGTIHVHEPIEVEKEVIGAGCHVSGSFLTDKVTGNFRFGVEPQGISNEQGQRAIDFDLSHSVNHLAFLPTNGKLANDKLPDLPTSIQRQMVVVPADSSIFQYSIQVVSTEYKTLYGELSFLNQYSVNEKIVDSNQLARNELLSGLSLRDFHGLIVTYDFNPVSDVNSEVLSS
jgi:hypothetical protein